MGHIAIVMKGGKCTAETPHCGVAKDVEEDEGREELQTHRVAGVFPLWLWREKAASVHSSGLQEAIRANKLLSDIQQCLCSRYQISLGQSVGLCCLTIPVTGNISMIFTKCDHPVVMSKPEPDGTCLLK